MKDKNESKKSKKSIIIIVVVFSIVTVLLISLAAFMYIWQNNEKVKMEDKYNKLLEKVEEEQMDDDSENDEDDAKDNENKDSEDAEEDDKEDSEENKEEDSQTTEDSDLVKVDWLDMPIRSEGEDKGGVPSADYKLGNITSGQYEGGEVHMEIYEELGVIYNRYISHNGQKINTADSDIKIEGVDNIPDKVSYPNSDVMLEKGYLGADTFSQENKLELGAAAFSDDNGREFYQTEEGCFVTKLADGTLMPYNMKLPFATGDSGDVNLTVNGEQITGGYVYEKITGCGALCSLLKEDEVQSSELTEVGYASNQDKIYALTDNNHALLTELYNDKNTLPYYDEDRNKTENSKYTYDEFLALNPLLFWQDPQGKWIELKNSKLIYAAEMCKPVVYLYPENTEKLKVEVAPNGGFTYADPAYNGAWNVQASPSGEIVDLQTNSKYEYLFWEGVGLNLGEMDKGFMVKKEEMEGFLSDKLSHLGLNEKEINDFNEYWVNRLSEGEYYKISFVDQRIFDKIAPLNITPDEPDSVIRVFMLAKELESPYSIEEQKLIQRDRGDGFTVVEWGGALLK